MKIQIDEAAKTIDVQGTFTLGEVTKWMRDKYPDTWEEYKISQPIGETTYSGCWGCNRGTGGAILCGSSTTFATNEYPHTTVTFTQN